MNLDINSNIGGMNIYHEGNHADFGNPHNQYISKNNLINIPITKDIKNKYYKFAKIDITSDDTVVFLNFDFINANNNQIEEIKTASISCKINSSGKISTATRSVRLQEIESTNFNTNNIFAIVTQNNTTNYTVELWFEQFIDYKSYRVQVTKEFTNKNADGVNIEYYNDMEHVSTLSTGTIINIDRKIERMLFEVSAQTVANTGCKLFEIRLNKNNASKSCVFEILSSLTDAEPLYIRAIAKARCNTLNDNGTGTSASVTILDTSSTTGKTHLKIITHKADSEGVIVGVYLYFDYLRSNETYNFNINSQTISENHWSIISQIVVPNQFTWNTLPSGYSWNVTSKTVAYFGQDCAISRRNTSELGTNNDFIIGTGRFGGSYLRLGEFYLWFDASNRLRCKPSIPFSDTDGVVVGSQA